MYVTDSICFVIVSGTNGVDSKSIFKRVKLGGMDYQVLEQIK